MSLQKLHEHPLFTDCQGWPPILAIRSGQDQTVDPKNIDVFAERLQVAGGEIEVFRRDFYGHHPHGLDDFQFLVDSILKYYPAF